MGQFIIDKGLVERTGQTLEQIQELAEIFHLVDTDKGGTISRTELESLMQTLGISFNTNDMNVMMEEIANEKGEIDFESFVAIVTKKPNTTITLKELRGAFNVIDTYDDCHDGTILMDSLLKAFTVYSNQALSTEDALELIRQVAPQSDNGLFDYAQFLNIYFEPERVGDDGE